MTACGLCQFGLANALFPYAAHRDYVKPSAHQHPNMAALLTGHVCELHPAAHARAVPSKLRCASDLMHACSAACCVC